MHPDTLTTRRSDIAFSPFRRPPGTSSGTRSALRGIQRTEVVPEAMYEKDALIFARRSSEVVERIVSYLVFAAPMIVAVCLVSKLAYTSLTSNAGYSWIALPCAAFVAFMIFLLIYTSRTVRQAFADRRAALIVIDRTGVTLNRANPITVPWAEITDARLEQGFRGSTTLLRLDVRDPTVSEANEPGRVIDLRALADQPTNLLAAIQSRLQSQLRQH